MLLEIIAVLAATGFTFATIAALLAPYLQ